MNNANKITGTIEFEFESLDDFYELFSGPTIELEVGERVSQPGWNADGTILIEFDDAATSFQLRDRIDELKDENDKLRERVAARQDQKALVESLSERLRNAQETIEVLARLARQDHSINCLRAAYGLEPIEDTIFVRSLNGDER